MYIDQNAGGKEKAWAEYVHCCFLRDFVGMWTMILGLQYLSHNILWLKSGSATKIQWYMLKWEKEPFWVLVAMLKAKIKITLNSFVLHILELNNLKS